MNQLKYFLEAANSQHITKSAEKLHISQPSLTKAIHRLEAELEVPLFVAKGRNIVLTEYGKYLRRKLLPIMEEFDRLPEQMKMMAQLEKETIHLNVLAASEIVIEAIMEYKKTHRNINFQLMQNSESQLYDIGVSTRLFYHSPENKAAYETVYTEKIHLAVPASHRLARKKSINLKEAEEEGFISLMGSRQLRWICDRFCAHAGFTPQIIFESDNPAVVKNMIAANMGVGFWPEFTWGRIENDRVKILRIHEPLCQRNIIIDYKQNKVDGREVRKFYEFLISYCNTAIQAPQ